MKKHILIIVLFCISYYGISQAYHFTTLVDIDAMPVISQGKTGTCWSFSTSSFLESEIMKNTGKTIDLSEMFNVRQTYLDKAWNYVMRHGHAQFSEGGLSHDVINSINKNGMVPITAFTGLRDKNNVFNHETLTDTLKVILDQYIKDPKAYSGHWKDDVNTILDSVVGKNITHFTYQGKSYTPKSFLEYTKINPNDYISITSFKHHPYYSSFILSIPDNFSNGTFYNVPLNDLIEITNHALQEGFSIALDCDVSEKTFLSEQGIALIPENNISTDTIENRIKEKQITADYREQEFENFNTTDDHLMHITGLVKDQNGTLYYKVKNSWGSKPTTFAPNGFIYISEAYFKLKTISIMLNKKALNKTFRKKLLQSNKG